MAKQEAGRNFKRYYVFLWEFRNILDFFHQLFYIHNEVTNTNKALLYQQLLMPLSTQEALLLEQIKTFYPQKLAAVGK